MNGCTPRQKLLYTARPVLSIMRLSIIIPAYNEAERLPATLENIHQYFASGASAFLLHEVIVVDDGSTDATEQTASAWQERLPLHVLRLSQNRGKGAATRAGMLQASGEYHLLYDADGATPLEMLEQFAHAVREQGAHIVIGSRVHEGGSDLVRMSFHRRLMGRTYHALCSRLAPGIRDTACGCKLFAASVSHDVFSRQTVDRFAFDVEVLSISLQRGYRIRELPVHWRAVAGSKVRVVRDTAQMAWSVLLLYIRFTMHGTLPPRRSLAGDRQ